jgi:hypothetical protein
LDRTNYADIKFLVVQTIGGAFLVSAGESAFEAILTKKLHQTDPSVSALKVIGTGATDVRTTFSATDLPFILNAYVKGIQTAFIVSITFAALCTVLAFAAPWKKLESADAPAVTEETEVAESGIKIAEDSAV